MIKKQSDAAKVLFYCLFHNNRSHIHNNRSHIKFKYRSINNHKNSRILYFYKVF